MAVMPHVDKPVDTRGGVHAVIVHVKPDKQVDTRGGVH
eukprot:COSAG01_NODE_22331_length_860_cov_0.943495_1_plen_37_part_10